MTDFHMVVDYQNENAKILFDSYPMPSIDQAFDQFSGDVVFSVFDHNSAYFQIPLSPRRYRVTDFSTPFALISFNRLLKGIRLGSQGVTRVVEEQFSYMNGRYVFNKVNGMLVYCRSVKEHMDHVRDVLQRQQVTGFTLNPD